MGKGEGYAEGGTCMGGEERRFGGNWREGVSFRLILKIKDMRENN